MKKLFTAFLLVLTVLVSTACRESTDNQGVNTLTAQESIKIGVICVGDENDSYTKTHVLGIKQMMKTLGLKDEQVIFKYNVSESGNDCKNAAVELSNIGCNIVFGTSYGYGESLQTVAQEYPDVSYCHASGNLAQSSGLDNTCNYYVAAHEARYVSGIAAGMKLQEMINNGVITAEQAKIGYIGSFPNAELRSGYTAFYLGAKSVVPYVRMEVKYTDSWSDSLKERVAAEELIDRGCKIISHHTSASSIAEIASERGIPFVGYNYSDETGADTMITSVQINWGAYYTYAVGCVINGETINADWCGGYRENTVLLSAINEDVAADGTSQELEEAVAAIKSGEEKIFDIRNWTVGGKRIVSTVDVEGYDGKEYIVDEAFTECTLESAPAFNFVIDGIVEIE